MEENKQEQLYDIRCIEDGAIMPNRYDGKPRNYEQAKKRIDSLHQHSELHYEMVPIFDEVKSVINYCHKNSITPEQLIEQHQSQKETLEALNKDIDTMRGKISELQESVKSFREYLSAVNPWRKEDGE